MTDLLDDVLAAHGGVRRWHELSSVSASIVTGGQLFGQKGQPQDPAPRRMTVALHRQWASVQPFGAPDQRTSFSPHRIAIEKLDGRVVAERPHPESSFASHGADTAWDPLHRAFFNGYALWTYLTTPFLLVMAGFSVVEADPLEEDGETWRCLRATFPPDVVSHSSVQDFYFGADFLLRRHDYQGELVGGGSAAQYVHDYREADGIRLPTKRRAYLRDENGRPDLDALMVSIDFAEVRFE
ncbi:hypothetical protein MOQ72_24380 [Saccharopolyspora sp. K220]|uniref:hypothetical protein n=1 Tax=Saccharopolyspora soli TaxID=2926618 RepID=UPI001F56B74B|nr:hypothetical protein [Saccharopolyspora soli]MCI2420593.1 hypothetical protein [Saccharopolyspora soli]